MAEVKNFDENGVIIDENGFHPYGTPGYIQILEWHDAQKRDYLVITSEQKESEVLAARAKGTTIYEIIDIYGGIDEVTAAYAGKEAYAIYDDVSDMPEFADDSAYDQVIKNLAKAVLAEQARQTATSNESKDAQQINEEMKVNE